GNAPDARAEAGTVAGAADRGEATSPAAQARSSAGVAVASGTQEISPLDLKRRLDAKEDLFILDVREPHEYQICNLGGYLIPLNDLPRRVSELDSSRTGTIVAHCKMGGRSAKAAEFLRQAGFQNVLNLTGCINARSEKVDPKVPKY